MNSYELATMAGCLQPDAEDTYGAHWLTEIQWRVQNERNPLDREVHAKFMAVSPPVWRAWKLFAELGGWQFAPAYAQHVGCTDDLNDIARRALYSIASKLVRELAAMPATQGSQA